MDNITDHQLQQANQMLHERRVRERHEKQVAGLAASPRPAPPSLLVSSGDCPHCGRPILPQIFEVGQGKTIVIPRYWCSCPGGQADMEAYDRQKQRSTLDSRYSQYLNDAGLTVGKYRKMTFDLWDANRHPGATRHLTDALEYCRALTPDGPNLCYLYGKNGTGKTHLAVSCLSKIIYDHLEDNDVGWTPCLIDWSEHCSLVQESWTKKSFDADYVSESHLWGRMKRADILVIDDLDKRAPTEWALGKLYEVVQHRYMRERAAIITANHSIEQLQEIWLHPSRPDFLRDLGSAILSRFTGQLAMTIECTGPDQRDY